MAQGKKSFILYCDLIRVVEKMPDEIAGKLFKIILKYVNDEAINIDNLLLEIAFEPIKQQLKRDLKSWEKYTDKQRLNGMKGGRPKNPKEPKKTQPFLKEPKKAVTVTVNDTVTVNENKEERLKPFDFKKSLLDLGVGEEEALTYLKIRKTKRLTNSKIAFEAIKKEIHKSNIAPNECIKKAVENSWGGFKADWLTNNTSNDTSKRNNETEADRRYRAESAGRTGL